MEKAVCDMADLFKLWNEEPKKHLIDDVFSYEKVLYLLIQCMNLLLTLHKENVCCGDFKPPNCLLFHNYTIKLGDFGGCIKVSEYFNFRRAYSSKYSHFE